MGKILPMNIDVRARVEPVQHYTKVLVLDHTFRDMAARPTRLAGTGRSRIGYGRQHLNQCRHGPATTGGS